MTKLRLMPEVERQAFQTMAALLGFDIVRFDAWLAALEPCGAKEELSQRRAQAVDAMLLHDRAELLRHLEWMLLRWGAIAREERLLPLARKGQQFKPKGRGPGPMRKAIAAVIKRKPAAPTAVIWTTLSLKPPRGWTFCDNHLGKYAEGPKGVNVGYSRFENLCSEERKKAKLTE